jgi:hypothetical protein
LILPPPDVLDTKRRQASHTLGKNIPGSRVLGEDIRFKRKDVERVFYNKER